MTPPPWRKTPIVCVSSIYCVSTEASVSQQVQDYESESSTRCNIRWCGRLYWVCVLWPTSNPAFELDFASSTSEPLVSLPFMFGSVSFTKTRRKLSFLLIFFSMQWGVTAGRWVYVCPGPTGHNGFPSTEVEITGNHQCFGDLNG